MEYKALKKFGQNYLNDKNILQKIAETINAQSEDTILEIGPGYGALTEYVYPNTTKYLAVEIDTRVLLSLAGKFPELKVVNQDFLKYNLSDYYSGNKIRVIGNIPYNITSPILFKLIEEREKVEDITFMVQLEVGKRMCALQGSKDYGILSVLLEFFTDRKLCFKVSRNCFNPKPNVDSAIINLKFHDKYASQTDSKIFIKVVKAAFGNRRKQLKNSFSNSEFKDIDFELGGFNMTKRAEELKLVDFINLTNFVIKQK